MPLKWEVKSFKFPPSYPKVEKNTYMVLSQRKRIHLPTQEMRVQSLGQEDPLEKEKETHPSILAWDIPCTKEPGRLESMGSQESDTT